MLPVHQIKDASEILSHHTGKGYHYNETEMKWYEVIDGTWFEKTEDFIVGVIRDLLVKQRGSYTYSILSDSKGLCYTLYGAYKARDPLTAHLLVLF